MYRIPGSQLLNERRVEISENLWFSRAYRVREFANSIPVFLPSQTPFYYISGSKQFHETDTRFISASCFAGKGTN